MILLANIGYDSAGFLILGIAIGCGVLWLKDRKSKKLQALEAESILNAARREADSILRDARSSASEEALKTRRETEESFSARARERDEIERRLAERERLINAQLEKVLESEKNLQSQKTALESQKAAVAAQEAELSQLAARQREQLQSLSHITELEARTRFLKEIEQESLEDAGNLSRNIIEQAKNRAEEKARQIISVAIQRYAGEHTFETTTSTIALQGDDIKGRIIGRDGRNIRAFEAATGITVLIDDTPNAVVLSGFDPVRREIARESMTRLILDGRIHPTRIEEVVQKVSQETDETVMRLGEEAVHKAGVGPVAGEMVQLLGRLHFRLSYSQNVLDHSVEVAHLMGMMAGELGLDITTAKRAGLFHDIGKAMSHEIEGPHAIVGADFIKRHGETEEIVNAVASHHNDVPPVGPLGVLVSAADAISASRPGARSETMATYIKRIDNLEKIALSFPGVDKCFAVHAGRELRVMVLPEQVNDAQAFGLARNIATKIQDNMQYPGQIKITVIRETRCIEVAK